MFTIWTIYTLHARTSISSCVTVTWCVVCTYLAVVRKATQRRDVLYREVGLCGGGRNVTLLPDTVDLLVHLQG